MNCEIEKRRACGHNGADGKICSKELETIGDTPDNGTANESQRRCRTQHDPELFGPEPASRKKGRQKGRGSSECTEKCGVKHHKSKQYVAVEGHDLPVHHSGSQEQASTHLKHSGNVRYATEPSHGVLARRPFNPWEAEVTRYRHKHEPAKLFWIVFMTK
jgi:hypothetical protein